MTEENSESQSQTRGNMERKYLTVGLALFLGLAVSSCRIQCFSWDLPVTLWLQSLALPGLKQLMIWVSIPGNGVWLPYALVLAVYVTFLLSGKRREAEFGFISAAGGILLSSICKWVVGRPRPSADVVKVWAIIANESFPSGHVVNYLTFYGFLFCLATWKIPNRLPRATLQLVLGALILLVGPSRIYLGAHWASDVIGGYLLGAVWLYLSLQIYGRYEDTAVTADAQKT
jgi:membrane-associated phospholipid phosphatase